LNQEKRDEQKLIQAVANKNKEALKELFQIYHKRVFRYAFKMMGDYENADDITSEVFVTIWEKAASFKGHSSLSTWIFGITRNKILIFFTKRRRHVDLEDANCAHDSREMIHKHQDLQLALNTLSEEHREALEMIFFLGLSYDEAAQVLGCPVGTVKSRIFHAKKLIGKFLSANSNHSMATQ